jgi:hypothetical protein
MKRSRLALLVPAVAVMALGLTACEKPNPSASAFSGTTTVYQQAPCWAPEGSTLDEKSCPQDLLLAVTGDGAKAVPLLAGQTIGIAVDPSVADVGWFPVLGGTRLTSAPVKDTYFRFTPTEQQAAAATTLAVVAGNDTGTRGVWMFTLKPA